MTKAPTVAARRRAKALFRVTPQPTAPSRPRARTAEATCTPTPERQAKGHYTVSTKGRVYRDDDATPLRRALRRGVLALREVEAGEHVEELWHALHGSSGRSCLDIGVRGSGETDPERTARLGRVLDRYRAAAGGAWGAVLDVVVMHGALGKVRYARFKRVKAGLSKIAEVREGVST
ncbi:MAG: hypothetical protein AAGI34_07180 [Pseudomonadota bacterium]